MSEPNESESEIVYEFERGEGEVIRATISEFKGVLRVDLRTFYLNEDEEWRPTKKGINLPFTLLPELKKALQALEASGGERS